MTEVERTALASFARSLDIPIEHTRFGDCLSVFLGRENIQESCAYSDYQDAIAFLIGILVNAPPG